MKYWTKILKPNAGQILLALGLFAIIVAGLVAAVSLTDKTHAGVNYFLMLNLYVLLSLIALIYISRKLISAFLERKKGLEKARLHLRFLGLLSFFAVVPVAVVAAFSIILLNLGVESWFSARVAKSLDGSVEVAQAYLSEHGQRLMGEAEYFAGSDQVKKALFFRDLEQLGFVFDTQIKRKQFAEASVYTKKGEVVLHYGALAPLLPERFAAAMQTSSDESVLLTDYKGQRMIVMTPINQNLYMVLSRWISPQVLAHLGRTREAYQEYYGLKSEVGDLRLLLTAFFVMVVLAVLAGAVWAGLNLASRIVRPLGELVKATKKVREGDLSVRVQPRDDDEVGVLTSSFNLMTERMGKNQKLLEQKNREIADRREMTEAVMQGVTAGVMRLDENGIVRMANAKAEEMFGVKCGEHINKFDDALAELFKTFKNKGSKDVLVNQTQTFIGEKKCTLQVRMMPQTVRRDKKISAIVTFDDISELLSAQRVAAWADVAQRLAHEIKNPLTPIQLSTERLKRKYLKEIPEAEQELFKQLTDTVTQQVEDMRSMLNEFSDFARMPQAQFELVDVVKIIKEVVLLQQTAHPELKIQQELETDLFLLADRTQISRMLTNLVQNAINAIEENPNENKAEGVIKIVAYKQQSGKIAINVTDNGPGFPQEVDLDTLFDPYITTRKKGTGLGLAIVRRVVDEHEGQVRLERLKQGGSQVTITLPTEEEGK